jgi:hypothetical protein
LNASGTTSRLPIVAVILASTVVAACGGGSGLEAPAGLSYSANPAAYTVGTAITANTPSSSGGAVTSFSVTPALPAGLSLNTASGVVSGNPAAVAAIATYTVTATNSAGSATASLSITVNAAVVPPAGLTYSLNPAAYEVGTVVTPNVPSSSGDAVVSYSVTPALPGGLRLSTTTGVISGTPTTVAATSNYTVTASNSAGQATTAITITVASANTRPVANAGTSQKVPVGSTVALDGSASSDADGNPLTYAWSLTTKPTGSTAVISNVAGVQPTITTDQAGQYVATLIVNDGRIDSSPSTVSISSAADLRLLIAKSASQSSFWNNGVAQAGSQFILEVSNTSSNTTFPLNRMEFSNGGVVLLTSVDPSLLHLNHLGPGESAGIVVTINSPMTVDFFNPIRFAYYLTDPGTLDEFAVDAPFYMACSDCPLSPVSTVTVALGSASLNVGLTTKATPLLKDASGIVLPGRAVTWSSSNKSVATVDHSGLVTAVGAGAAKITALSEGQKGSADILAFVPVSTVSVALAASSVIAGQGTQATATLRDANGNVLTGRTVTWATSNVAVARVDANGGVTAVGVGTASIAGTCEGMSGAAPLTVNPPPPGPPTQITPVSALKQTTGPGQAVLQPPAVVVRDAVGTPVPGVSVSFVVTAGNGAVTGSPATTDASGVARAASWTLGALGDQSIQATSPAINSVTANFEGRARASSDGFDITLWLSGSMTDSQTRAFVNAKERIEEIIVGDLPSFVANYSATALASCGGREVVGTIDDVLIVAEIKPIDGVGNILGQAGPCYVRSSSKLPFLGHMQFDSADIAQLEASGRLDSVILHEMMHVVGFGTVWTNLALLTGSGTADPYFTGSGAGSSFLSYNDGNTYVGNPVPVENTGGTGTVNSHWRETVFKSELMTGWLSGTSQPFSRTTAASLADLGYAVDLTKADAYSILSALRAAAVGGGEPRVFLGDDVRLIPPIAVDDAGRPVGP